MVNDDLNLIAVDKDDVLFDFVAGFIRYIREFHQDFYKRHMDGGVQFSKRNFHCYHLNEVIDCSLNEVVRLVNGYYRSDSFDNIPLIEGAQKGIEELVSQGFDLVSVTSSSTSVKDKTIRSFDKYFPGAFKDIYFAGGQPISDNGSRSKGEICSDINAGILIDDAEHHTLSCLEYGIIPVLLKSPWNKGVNNSGIFIGDNWNEVVEHIGRLRI